MHVSLIVIGGVHDGREVPVRAAEFVIGRDPSCQLRPASNEVSRQHCAIVLRDDGIFLRDYGSRNGTVVNGRVLRKGELQLEDGDVLQVGPLAFRVGVKTPAEMAAETDDDVDLFADDSKHAGVGDTLLAPRTEAPRPTPKPRDENELLCE